MRARNVGNIGMKLIKTNFRSKSILDALENVVGREGCSSDGVGDPRAPGAGHVDASWEQSPNYDSRVKLSSEVDKFALRKVSLDWRLSEGDRRTAREFALEMGRFLARTNYGRLKAADWLMEDDAHWPKLSDGAELAGFHHIGTTRMASNSSRGVVDRECRVFGIRNLYIAGSSVFTTAGHSNPTLTIVQLALRLAKHLAQLNKKSAPVRIHE